MFNFIRKNQGIPIIHKKNPKLSSLNIISITFTSTNTQIKKIFLSISEKGLPENPSQQATLVQTPSVILLLCRI